MIFDQNIINQPIYLYADHVEWIVCLVTCEKVDIRILASSSVSINSLDGNLSGFIDLSGLNLQKNFKDSTVE